MATCTGEDVTSRDETSLLAEMTGSMSISSAKLVQKEAILSNDTEGSSGGVNVLEQNSSERYQIGRAHV